MKTKLDKRTTKTDTNASSNSNLFNLSSVSFKVPFQLDHTLFSLKTIQKKTNKRKSPQKAKNFKFTLIQCQDAKTKKLLVPHHLVNRNTSVNAITSETLVSFLKKFNFHFNFMSPKTRDIKQNFDEENLLKKNFSYNLVLIDCRFEYEFKGGSIKNSIHIPDPRTIEHIFIKNRKLFQFLHFRFLFAGQKGKTMTIESFERLKEEFFNYNNLNRHSPDKKKAKIDQNNKKSLSLINNKFSFANENETKNIKIKMAKPNQIIKFEPNSFLFKSTGTRQSNKSRTKTELDSLIIVFYCEFSSKRAPGIYSFLRGLDRMENMKNYPKVYYPNIYLLEGGYSNFVEKHDQYCVGKGEKYQRMLDKQHRSKYLKENNKLREIWDKLNKGARKNYNNIF